MTQTKYKVLYVAILAVMIFFNYFLFHKLDVLKNQKAIADENLKAATGKIFTMKTRADSIEYLKTVYFSKAADLVKLNQELSDELKKEGGDTKFLAAATASINSTDTVYIPGQIKYVAIKGSKDTSLQFNFAYNKTFNGGSRALAGYTTYNPENKTSSTAITQDDLSLNLVTGIKHDDKNGYTIFLRSDYPGFAVNKLDGAVLDPTMFQKPAPKLWHIGPSAGVQYNLQAGKTQPYIGIGITRSIISF